MTSTRTFLIIDDDPDGLFLLERALQKQFPHCTIVACDSPEVARGHLDEIAVDAIVTDYHLRLDSGVEFIQVARQSGVTCPIVMITGSVDPKVEQSAYAAGATKVFTAGRGDFAGYLAEVLGAGGTG